MKNVEIRDLGRVAYITVIAEISYAIYFRKLCTFG